MTPETLRGLQEMLEGKGEKFSFDPLLPLPQLDAPPLWPETDVPRPVFKKLSPKVKITRRLLGLPPKKRTRWLDHAVMKEKPDVRDQPEPELPVPGDHFVQVRMRAVADCIPCAPYHSSIFTHL